MTLSTTASSTHRSFIAELYDRGADEEQRRLFQSPREQAEFVLVKELLSEFVRPQAKVLDVGAGPGRYAEFLLRHLECRVGLVELSARSLELFKRRVPADSSGEILFTHTGCATQLGWLDDGAFDAVLLMGPLYHLLDPNEREAAIKHAIRLLKPDGFLFVTFISPFSIYPRLLKNDAELLFNERFLDDLQRHGLAPTSNAVNISGAESTYEFFSCWPSEAWILFESFGVQIARTRSLEGLIGLLDDEQIRPLNDGRRRDAWIRFHRKNCEHPDVLGATIHYIVVGQVATDKESD